MSHSEVGPRQKQPAAYCHPVEAKNSPEAKKRRKKCGHQKTKYTGVLFSAINVLNENTIHRQHPVGIASVLRVPASPLKVAPCITSLKLCS